MPDPFSCTSDDVPGRPGALGEGSGAAWWDRAPFSLRVLRQMNKTDGPCFGEEFLWVLLATKEGPA